MNIPEAIELLERGLIVKDGLPGPKCQTGEEYVVYSESGFKPEGQATDGIPKCRYSSEDDASFALRYWLKHVIDYKVKQTPEWAENKYTIYWRHPHNKVECEEYNGKWYIYSRFIITGKEEVNG